jgi:hypothetical protein
MQYLKDLFKKDWKLYYRTPELNEKLFLHYKGKFNVFNSLGLNKAKFGPHGD